MKSKIFHEYNKKDNSFKKFKIINNDYIDLIKSNLAKKSMVLDLGCGGGRLTRSINEYAQKVIGIDFAEELIRQAKQHAQKKNITYKVMDGEKLLFNPETFDMVVSHAVINKKMCRANLALKEVYSVLKPEGKLIIKIIYCTWGKEFEFKGGYSKKEIIKILKNIGFKNISIIIQREKFKADSYENIKWIRDTEAPHLSPKKTFENFLNKSNQKYIFDDSFMIVYAEK